MVGGSIDVRGRSCGNEVERKNKARRFCFWFWAGTSTHGTTGFQAQPSFDRASQLLHFRLSLPMAKASV